MPAEVIVVGAGIIGASIAWHLVAAGAAVTVVEAGEAGGVATPCSFAWINAARGNPDPYYRLRIRSMAEWRRLHETVTALPLSFCGGLAWDMSEAERAAYLDRHGALGYGLRAVDAAEAARLEPALADPPEMAVHVPGEGAVEPDAAARLLLDDAVRRGARVLSRRAVTALDVQGLGVKGGRVTGIVTAEGMLAADEVVLAAGAATPGLAAGAGIGLRMTTSPGLLVHSRPRAKLLNGLVLSPGLHVRQTAAGRLVFAADFGGSDVSDAAGLTARLVGQVKRLLRGVDDLVADFHTVGHRPIPADRFPVVGRPAGIGGLYLAVMHSGITLAPAVGMFAAREILEGGRDPLLAPYGADRFG